MSADYNNSCPIWGTPAKRTAGSPPTTVFVESFRAGGNFFVEKAIINNGSLFELDIEHKVSLCAYILKQNLLDDVPIVDSELLSKIEFGAALTYSEKFNLVLKLIRHNSDYPGAYLNSAEQTLKLAAAVGSSETDNERQLNATVLSFLEHGEYRNLLELKRPAHSSEFSFKLTHQGFVYLEDLGYQLSASDQIFIAMWFHNALGTLLDEAIKPAVIASGYFPQIISQLPTNNKIDDEILAEIRKSKALIADLTCGLATPVNGWSETGAVGAPRGGVYYEAGFADGLGLPVIYMVKKEIAEIENVVHFDVRQFNQIRWNSCDLEAARKELENRIVRTIGKGNYLHPLG